MKKISIIYFTYSYFVLTCRSCIRIYKNQCRSNTISDI